MHTPWNAWPHCGSTRISRPSGEVCDADGAVVGEPRVELRHQEAAWDLILEPLVASEGGAAEEEEEKRRALATIPMANMSLQRREAALKELVSKWMGLLKYSAAVLSSDRRDEPYEERERERERAAVSQRG
ncbi:hypothetical protein CDL15_Pgr015834 [Punica granatum]|uniref:Uncharacterized protein n=1 Tax=Punica granatum TaxID=22663 RepID=A0A218XPS9_PUNGR|nr:hypothetical protein CDL15_Pgr015834 [Punica granatum]